MRLEADGYRDSNGIYSLEIEWAVRWEELGFEEQRRYVRYLKGIYDFRSGKKLSREEKKWLLENMDVEIDLIPDKWHRIYDLSGITNLNQSKIKGGVA